jgi:hypothetical protein
MLDAGVGDPHELAMIGIAGVDLVDRAPAVHGVHEPVVDERIDLVLGTILADILHAAQRQGPNKAQVLDVVPIDLGELGIPGRTIVAVHHQPVLRLVLRVDEPIAIDRHLVFSGLGRLGESGERDAEQNGARDVDDAVTHSVLPRRFENFGAAW